MKRFVVLIMTTALVAGLAFAGGGKEELPEAIEMEDGYYFQMAEEFGGNGWKDLAYFTVEDSKIVAATWDSVNVQAGPTKYVQSKNGEYGMLGNSDAQSAWYEQADASAEWLIENQDPSLPEMDEEGYTDAISGVSIHVSGFFPLVEQALREGPDGMGMYQDGVYTAEADDFGENGWKDTMSITVAGSYIASVYWDSVDQEGRSKKELSDAGEYGMVANSDATVSWADQARAVEEYLVENQTLSDLTLDDEGRTDAISTATIHIDSFEQLVTEALDGAMR